MISLRELQRTCLRAARVVRSGQHVDGRGDRSIPINIALHPGQDSSRRAPQLIEESVRTVESQAQRSALKCRAKVKVLFSQSPNKSIDWKP